MTKKNIEEKLLNVDLETLAQQKNNLEIESANRKLKEVIITDKFKLNPKDLYDGDTIYMVYHRKHKVKSFVRGDQVKQFKNDSETYFVRFDHRIEYK